MNAHPPTVDDRAVEIARSFLQTAVVVDDEAYSDSRRRTEPDTGAQQPAGRGVSADLEEPPEDPKELPAQPLLEAFAKRGLICSFIAPPATEEALTALVHIARRADLLVLDWVMGDGGGQTAIDLISKMVAADTDEHSQRLRAVAIYTGEDDIPGIAVQLQERLAATLPNWPLTKDAEDDLSFSLGPIRLAVYAKEHAQPIDEALGHRLTLAQLPDRLISDFAHMTAGLVPGVAFTSLAALRRNTYQILGVLGADLDVGYLGHRAALPDAPDAERHVIDIVIAELRTVLDDQQAGKAAGFEAICAWLDEMQGKVDWGRQIEVTPPLSLSDSQVRQMLETGLGDDEAADKVRRLVPTIPDKRMNVIRKQTHRAFDNDRAAADLSDAAFCKRMTVRTAIPDSEPVLRSGTIVSLDGAYRLCVQPLCDSIRLRPPGEAVVFPFLRFSEVARDKPARIVIGSPTAGYIRLAVKVAPSNINTYPFAPGAQQDVRAVLNGTGGYFFLDDLGGTHEWVAELKPDVARALGVELGQQFARLGVDEPETLRLSRR